MQIEWQDPLWPLGAYIAIGIGWLALVIGLARSGFDYVSPKEATIHLLAWPYVLIDLKLWWVAVVAISVVGFAMFNPLQFSRESGTVARADRSNNSALSGPP